MTLTSPAPAAVLPAARRPGPRSSTPLRLQLREDGPGRLRGLVDGAWWPYGDDLTVELGPLLAELARRGHLVHRVTYGLAGWRSAPRKVWRDGGLVRLGGFRTQPACAVHLVDAAGSTPLVLVVVPPGTAADVADRALRLAGTATDLDAPSVLAAARA